MRILLLEDDENYAGSIQKVLQEHGHEALVFNDGSRLIRYLEGTPADLLLLDWSVPGVSGIDVLWWVRKRLGRDLPIVFVTNRGLEEEVVSALEAGADDYMVKPVRVFELVARINALLRRSYSHLINNQKRFEVGPYTIDIPNQTISLENDVIETTPREFEIAFLLFSNFGRIVPRENLIKRIWGRDLDKTSRSLDTHIYRIRRKLQITAAKGIRLRVIYTHGYRLESTSIEESPVEDDMSEE